MAESKRAADRVFVNRVEVALQGNPDPAKRRASTTFHFEGADALARANAVADMIRRGAQ